MGQGGNLGKADPSGLAEANGDVDELAAIKLRDISSGYRYLDIAEIWAKAR